MDAELSPVDCLWAQRRCAPEGPSSSAERTASNAARLATETRVDSPSRTVYRPPKPVSRNDLMRISIVLAPLLIVAGCSTAPDIVKTGVNIYKVRPDAGGGSPNDAEIKSRGIKRANEFCDAQGKRAVITIGQTSGWFVLGLQTAEVQFYCDERPAAKPSDKTTRLDS